MFLYHHVSEHSLETGKALVQEVEEEVESLLLENLWTKKTHAGVE